MSGILQRFLIIDDDPIYTRICQFHIQRHSPGTTILSFPEAEQALAFIRSGYDPAKQENISIIILNINMPGLSGWEFLDAYSRLDESVRQQIRLYVASASVDPNDIKNALSNPYVKKYLVKPLAAADILQMITDL